MAGLNTDTCRQSWRRKQAGRPGTAADEATEGSMPRSTVEQITGTPPRPFRDFARNDAAAGSEDSK